STRNVRHTSLNFDNFMLPIHLKNDEIRSSIRIKCIIMSQDSSSKSMLYRQISAKIAKKLSVILKNQYETSTAKIQK
ncbi:hypothetical protein BLOT_009510, partial [Blomia tropicalis]